MAYLGAVKHPAFQSRFGFPGILLLAGLLLWIITTWPLVRLFSKAIPHTNINPELQVVCPIIPGDHLQLLYHFWLGLDALTGHSPFFHNVYEFNLGDDAARFQPYLYYLPFSLVYAAIAPVAGHAAGWNAAGLASVLLGVLGLGLLARRFSDSAGIAFGATLVAATFPFRWIPLFTGSPTGFAMAFPPLLFYGIDRAIRDRSVWGGTWAGLALFFSYATDLHTFYFSALAAPGFALLSFWMAQSPPRLRPDGVRAIFRPLIPLVLLAGLAIVIGAAMNRHLSETSMASGRSLAELALFSPKARGLVSTAANGMDNHVFFGIPLFALLGTLLVHRAFCPGRRMASGLASPRAEGLAICAFLAAIAVVILLALGIHGPFEGLPVRIIRKVVPKYTMIRQTVKIYCLMPALLAPLLGLLLSRVRAAARESVFGLVAAGLVLALSIWTLRVNLAQTTPGFCTLPKRNAVYDAVAHDEKANGGRPAHALALPLWPGDSHWNSLYEYAVMVSRVRLVNGYSPAAPGGFLENVFKKYASLNQGHATDEQLDGLLELGVRHLLFHSNEFTEKVSPFPAAVSLRALVDHPRLALIAEDGQTFAFRILPKHPVGHAPHANWTDGLHAAARHWSWDPPLEIANAQSVPIRWVTPVGPAPDIRFLLRLGGGSAQPLLMPPGPEGSAQLTHPVAGLPDWLQAELPSPTGTLVNAHSGGVALEYALITAGELPAPGPDGTIRIAPAMLFHAGHSSPGDDSVAFYPETVPARRVLYGPNLPFPPGVYDITLSYTLGADAHPADPPGFFRILTLPEDKLIAEMSLDFETDHITFHAITLDADPVYFEFDYTAQTSVVFHRIELAPATLRLEGK